jgi:mRNA-degrading endonuclease RelE of RelBE toxin-antitoxin system
VALDVARWGSQNADFVPTLEQLESELESNPKQFPPKRHDLAGARAAELVYRGKMWRVVFDVDDDVLEVLVLSIAPHDRAYRQAERRR